MKIRITLALIIFFALQACNNDYLEVRNKEVTKGDIKISVEGKRTTPLGAWRVTINVRAYGYDNGELVFDLYAKDINDKTLLFEWEDDHNCHIQFIQQDDSRKNFRLSATEHKVILAEE